jgi:hypothetical protein
MIGISGALGVGKSFFLAEDVYRASKAGFFIITNFSHAYSNIDCSQLSPEEFYEVLKELALFKERGFEMCDLYPGFRHTGVLIAIDEGSLYFSPEIERRKSSELDHILRLLAQARKLDIEIKYVVQDPAVVGKLWRRYTDFNVHYRPLIGWRRKIPLQHHSKPTYRREWRYVVPFVWEEIHQLDAENPVINMKRTYHEGFSDWSAGSTLVRRKLRATGSLKPWVYKMYDSYQPLAMRGDDSTSRMALARCVREMARSKEPIENVMRMINKVYEEKKSFAYMKRFGILENDKFGYEPFPTFKKILGMQSREAVLPTKVFFENVILVGEEKNEQRKIKMEQAMVFVKSMHEYRAARR